MTQSNRTRGATAIALHFINEQIVRSRDSGNLRLPNVRELAAKAGVSPKSVWKALGICRDAGLVSVIPGGGVFISPGSGNLDPRLFEPKQNVAKPIPRVKRQTQLYDTLSEDLLSGRYAPGTMLPAYKELKQRYGACYTVLRKALTSLAEQHRIVPFRKGFRVHESPAQKGRPVIVYIYSRHLGQTYGLVHAHPFSTEFWGQVEHHRVRLGVDVDLVHHDAALGLQLSSDSGPALSERYRGRAVLGCMVSTLGFDREMLDAVLMDVTTRRWRTAVLVEGSDPPLARGFIHHPLIRFYALAGGERAGKITGQFLLSLGHRHAAFFTAFSGTQFSRNRIAGVREVFENAGGCSLDIIDATLDNWETIAIRQPVFRAFRRSVARYERLTTPSYEPQYTIFSNNVANHHMASQYMKHHLVAYFERILKNPKVTAWIGVNDVIGLIALSYLRGNSIAVPEHISVTSFDNTVDSFGQGLTSYDFNVTAIVNAMFEHILESRRKPSGEDPIIEIPGTMMARKSCGQAPTPRPAV